MAQEKEVSAMEKEVVDIKRAILKQVVAIKKIVV